MRKFIIVGLSIVAACHRQAEVGSPPSANVPGAPTPRAAVQAYLAAAAAQDLQALALVWGDARGPARDFIPRDELERREVILIKGYLCQESYQIVGDSPAAGGERILAVTLKRGALTRGTNFYATRGPAERWFVRSVDPEPLRDFCTRR